MSSGRLVWITRTQRNQIAALSHHDPESVVWVRGVLDAWDAAPADPAEAIAKILFSDAFDERYDWREIDADTRAAWLESAAELLKPPGAPRAS